MVGGDHGAPHGGRLGRHAAKRFRFRRRRNDDIGSQIGRRHIGDVVRNRDHVLQPAFRDHGLEFLHIVVRAPGRRLR